MALLVLYTEIFDRKIYLPGSFISGKSPGNMAGVFSRATGHDGIVRL
jgi:hypothetical protein